MLQYKGTEVTVSDNGTFEARTKGSGVLTAKSFDALKKLLDNAGVFKRRPCIMESNERLIKATITNVHQGREWRVMREGDRGSIVSRFSHLYEQSEANLALMAEYNTLEDERDKLQEKKDAILSKVVHVPSPGEAKAD